jgi:hypothetical protein
MRAGCQLTIILLALLASGCAKSVKVQNNFPEPLVEKLPLSVGILLNDKLSNYVHVEDPMMDAEWTIDIGQANVDMFRALFTGMFRETIELKINADGTPLLPTDIRLNAIIEPRLEDFEFSVPRQSGNDQYTVWIRYNIRMTTPDDEQISNWRITAYGQVDEGSMGMGDADAMHAAAVIALRDAAANIATGFSKAPGVRKKLLEPMSLMPPGTEP